MSHYKTVGAISGHFPPRKKTVAKLSMKEKARIDAAVLAAKALGYDDAQTRTYVIERMDFDHPSCPGGMIAAYLGWK